MKVMLGSGGFRSEERRSPYLAATREHFGDRNRVLFVPYALADHDGYVSWMKESGFDAGYELVGVHTFDDPVRAVHEASAISVGGGNTFRLVRALQELGLVEAIAERVRAGVPYLGVSAGSNVACPTMQTTNDMPIVEPRTFAALGLVPFQINAHYFAGSTWVRAGTGFCEHFGEKRDDRIAEFHEENETPVLGLWEGSWIVIEDGVGRLEGGPARLFRRGVEAVDLAPGATLDELCSR